MPAVPCRAQQRSLCGMLRLRRSQHPTDLSWPKNTVNILGSVLCSLMVQDANTPKPTSYTQSLAPKETLCLHHMKSWICIQSQGEEHRERKDIGGWQEKEPKHAGLGMSCWQSCHGAKPAGVQAGLEAAQASLLILVLSGSRIGAALKFLLFSKSMPPGDRSSALGADFRFPSPRSGSTSPAVSPLHTNPIYLMFLGGSQLNLTHKKCLLILEASPHGAFRDHENPGWEFATKYDFKWISRGCCINPPSL